MTQTVIPERTVSFRAWRVASSNPRHEARPLPLPDDLETATEAALVGATFCDHKDGLLIVERDLCRPIGQQTFLHIHRIKRQSQGKYVRDPVTHETVRQQANYAELQMTVAVLSFDPLQPWQWSPDADVIGLDGGLVIAA